MFRRLTALGLNHAQKLRILTAGGTSASSRVVPRFDLYTTPTLGFSSNRFYSTFGDADNVEINLSDQESKRKLMNRLMYRSKQRGFLELDLVLGKWVEENIHSMDESGIKSLIQVLDLENPDLWKWLTGQEEAPEVVSANPIFSAVRQKVMGNLDNHAAPETRSTPGQPWVRGWDDIKRGQDSPVSGNQ